MEAVILAGSSVLSVAEKASNESCIPLLSRTIKKFANGEIYCQINSNVRGKHVFIIQSTSVPVNDNLMELLIMIDTVRRSFAERITIVCPHFGYARQDRQADDRTPITARLVADMISNAGASDFITLDIHSTQIGGFFDIPFLNINGDIIFRQQLRNLVDKYGADSVSIVSPDAGGMKRARKLAQYLNVPVAMIDKRRTGMNQAEAMHVVGDVFERHCIIYDDMVDTAGTLIEGVNALKENGALDIHACMSHGVLSGEARLRITSCDDLTSLIVSDSIPMEKKLYRSNQMNQAILSFMDKTTVISIGELLGKILRAKINNESISHLLR